MYGTCECCVGLLWIMDFLYTDELIDKIEWNPGSTLFFIYQK
jgi:hypothetical protein